jgi:hypothetical protein
MDEYGYEWDVPLEWAVEMVSYLLGCLDRWDREVIGRERPSPRAWPWSQEPLADDLSST